MGGCDLHCRARPVLRMHRNTIVSYLADIESVTLKIGRIIVAKVDAGGRDSGDPEIICVNSITNILSGENSD